ncbi:MAG: acyl-CoA carboxylase subunit beta [Gemmatimonadota bacterium]|uniref:acyl-CoA carboxylase subunit beta n=1 Tax=Candidatus Palauibacter scopulicola TaxID=3056741 RepID=UPI00239829B7|nr:acyl-CoA carboxylase subunit beta [Candidatus Palauibacter scopulicola]MDE2662477.1 acyl-CoA carboxylase subunit beta [Candidatus Palauibacter scopulicola]
MGKTDDSRMGALVAELRELEARIQRGGGEARVARQHAQGKLTARERVDLLIDEGGGFLEIGLLIAHDRYDGKAPAAGVVTGVGEVCGREVAIVANDQTVKAGSWWPETIVKILRAQEIAMRCRVPIVYLVDSAGVNLPYQGGVFPGQYGASRIFYYNSIMRHYLEVPQISAVMGQCIAGGAYLPALSDVIVMVEGTSFMGLGGPNLVKGATGQEVEAEELGGALMHNRVSGVAHYRVEDDRACIEKVRALVAGLPAGLRPDPAARPRDAARAAEEAYALLPGDHRQPFDMEAVLDTILDEGPFDEFQADRAPEMLTGTGHIDGYRVGVIANRRGMFRGEAGEPPKFGGIVYTESAEKVAYFMELCDRHDTPLLFVQDVSGFMVGPEAEQSGIIRAGARMVESMATARVPKIVLTVNHASGAGYYAMAAQGFDPDFIFTWPTGRMGVMEGEAAVQAAFGRKLEEAAGGELDEETAAAIARTRENYEEQLDAKYAAARGFVDAIVTPEDTRAVLSLALRCSLGNPGPHLGPFTLPDRL